MRSLESHPNPAPEYNLLWSPPPYTFRAQHTQNASGTVCCHGGSLVCRSITRNRFQPCKTTSLAFGRQVAVSQHLAGRVIWGLPRRSLANILGVCSLTRTKFTPSQLFC